MRDHATHATRDTPSPITSRVLEHVPHAFTTRTGGVSGRMPTHAHFASLNFGNPSELVGNERDPPDAIEANWRRLLEAMGVPERAHVQVHQVHGAAVHVVRRGHTRAPSEPAPKADAIVTDDPRVVIAVRIADCAPVLLATDDGRVVGTVHAGWRGVIAGVLPNAVRAMLDGSLGNGERGEERRDSRDVPRRAASSVRAAIGPCIEAAAFEVGDEVVAEFQRVFPDDWRAIVHPPGTLATASGTRNVKHHVDLKAALRIQLEALGVDRVDVIPGCTFSDAERFFSHRRDALKSGRLAAVIGAHAARP
jgi:copper oxidase (laccase) domain-containing protein